MKLFSSSKKDFSKLENTAITIKFPSHERQGIFKKGNSEFGEEYTHSLIYEESSSQMNEILLKKEDLKYGGKNKIKSIDAPVFCHNKGLEKDHSFPSDYQKLKTYFNNHFHNN